MSAAECELATNGDLSRRDTQRAVEKMWRCFKKHAEEVHRKGRRGAAEMNAQETPEAPRSREPEAKREEGCTLYVGEWEEVEEEEKAEAKRATGRGGEEQQA